MTQDPSPAPPVPAPDPSTDPRKAVVRRFYGAFNDGREDALDDLLAPDYLDFGGAPPREGVEAARANLRDLLAGFDDVRFDIEDLLAEGDLVAVRWTGRMVHAREFLGYPATGRAVAFSGVTLYRLRGDRIVEAHPAQDLFGLVRQLGE